MIYLHKIPAPQLTRYIECYWYADTNGQSLFNNKEIYFPDLRGELYFNLGEPYLVEGDGIVECDIHLWAPRQKARSLSSLHSARFLVVRFTPLGLGYFFGRQTAEMIDDNITFECIEKDSYNRLWDSISNRSFYAASEYLDNFFTSKLREESWQEKRAIHLYNNIIARPKEKISDSLKELGYSYKTAERHFRNTFGMTPKQIQSASKINIAINLLKSGQKDIEEVAFCGGFYDSSDMAGRFKESIGHTPTAIASHQGLILKALHPLLSAI